MSSNSVCEHTGYYWSKLSPTTRSLDFIVNNRMMTDRIEPPLSANSIVDHIYPNWSSVLTTPGKFENAALFQRLRLPSTHKLSRKRSFWKPLFKLEEFDNAGFPFSSGRKHLENGAFRKRWLHDNHTISPTEFSQTQIQNDRRLLRFLTPSV